MNISNYFSHACGTFSTSGEGKHECVSHDISWVAGGLMKALRFCVRCLTRSEARVENYFPAQASPGLAVHRLRAHKNKTATHAGYSLTN